MSKPKWLDPAIAPKDATMLLLLVEFYENSTDDNTRAVTMGFNNFDHNGIDEWLFAGWNWDQDCFTEGRGKVIGWWPLMIPEYTIEPD
ncbi:hypothetical protein phiK7B1_092 [Pseudomonas phage phiK7B1]|nr:hypothetical protein phiK7B1_092 [Pseudomonas phage phiK7B1]